MNQPEHDADHSSDISMGRPLTPLLLIPHLGTVLNHKIFLCYFPYFEKIKTGLKRSHRSLSVYRSVSVYPFVSVHPSV